MRLSGAPKPAVRRGHPTPQALQTYVDHEASPAESLQVARHLGDCGSCQTLHDSMTALARDLGSLPGLDVADDFSARVMERVHALPPPRRRARALRLAAPAVALVAALAALLTAPWTVRLAQGVGRWLPENPFTQGNISEFLLTAGAAALSTLGRVAERIVPWAAPPNPAPGVSLHSSIPMMLAFAALAAVLLGAALAGGGLLRLWSLRGDRPGGPR
jgi:anti-sigma factor RsiW